MDRQYLGTSLQLPIGLSHGAAVLADGLLSVEQSIMSILTTPLGTRFFLPEYGSRLDELLFEPNDIVLENLLRLFVFEALQKWEKRATFLDVDMMQADARVDVKITYRILPSNEINSFIFPFYRRLVY